MSELLSDKSLGDYVTLQRGNTYQGILLDKPGPVLLGLSSIARNGGFRADNLKTYGGDSDEKILLRPGDMYVSLKDVTQSADLLGAVARVPDFIESGRLTQDTVKLEFKIPDAPKDYIFWLLRTQEYRAYCRAHATGTTNLGLAREDFFSFPVPGLTPERGALVAALQSIEEKIELNRKMNNTLEAMGQALFTDWFVDFGPTLAKEGGAEPYLGEDIWSLFPDMIDEETRPKGWLVKQWGDLATLEYGKRLEGYQEAGGDIPVYGTNGLIGWHHSPLCPEPGIVIGRKGAYRGVHFSESPFYVIDTAFYLKPKVKYSRRWAYYTIKKHDINSMDSGSAIPSTSRDDFYRIPLIEPPYQLQLKYEEVLEPLWAKARANRLESETLAQLQGLLLPRLVSGDIRLKNGEKRVEEAV